MDWNRERRGINCNGVISIYGAVLGPVGLKRRWAASLVQVLSVKAVQLVPWHSVTGIKYPSTGIHHNHATKHSRWMATQLSSESLTDC